MGNRYPCGSSNPPCPRQAVACQAASSAVLCCRLGRELLSGPWKATHPATRSGRQHFLGRKQNARLFHAGRPWNLLDTILSICCQALHLLVRVAELFEIHNTCRAVAGVALERLCLGGYLVVHGKKHNLHHPFPFTTVWLFCIFCALLGCCSSISCYVVNSSLHVNGLVCLFIGDYRVAGSFPRHNLRLRVFDTTDRLRRGLHQAVPPSVLRLHVRGRRVSGTIESCLLI